MQHHQFLRPQPLSQLRRTRQPRARLSAKKTVAAGDETSGSSRFNSLADLKEKSPKVYNAMMVGIAQNICRDMEDGQQRLKRLMEEGRRNNS